MAVRTILHEACVGEHRWVALDEQDVPCSIHIERATDARRAVLGADYNAIVRAIRHEQGGAFVGLENGVDAFLRIPQNVRLTEGQNVSVRIASEARRDKLARAVLSDGAGEEINRLDLWRSSLNGGSHADIEQVSPGDPFIAAAVDEALGTRVTLAGGGTMRIESAAALTAADIDTAGRADKGRAAARAHNVNRIAARELARQVNLRRIGGLVVLDCIAPLNRESSEKIRKTFLSSLREIASRTCQTLPVSRFGLLEISLNHSYTPLRELMLRPSSQMTSETVCLEGIRALQREVTAAPMGHFMLELPSKDMQWLKDSRLDLGRQLDQLYGARLKIRAHDKNMSQVSKI